MRKYMEKNETNIIDRKLFDEATISGRPVKGGYKGGYIVRSYATPVACYSDVTNTWYLTNERFTVTTSQQISALHVILNRNTSRVVTCSPDIFASQLRELS